MPREFKRADRVADALQRELSEVIRHEIRDPRIGMVNINAVRVSSDLSTAKVYLTFVDNPKDTSTEERVSLLNKASGFLRTRVGSEMQLRILPKITFLHDETVYTADAMSKLIDRAIQSDAVKRGNQDET